MEQPPAGEHIMRMMSRLMRMHRNSMHALLQQYDVYPGQPPLMFALEREGGQSQNELARHLGIKAATLTVMLNRMEKAGMVRRENDANDQRVSRIYLTGQGRDVVRKVRDVLDMLENLALEGLDERDQANMRRLLARMSDNAARFPEAFPSADE